MVLDNRKGVVKDEKIQRLHSTAVKLSEVSKMRVGFGTHVAV